MNGEHNTGFQEQRRKRLEWLANYLTQVVTSDGVTYGQLRAKLLSKWGLTSEKTDEYLQIVIEAHGFELRQGRIFRAGQWQAIG
jgi:hypothetical protein